MYFFLIWEEKKKYLFRVTGEKMSSYRKPSEENCAY